MLYFQLFQGDNQKHAWERINNLKKNLKKRKEIIMVLSFLKKKVAGVTLAAGLVVGSLSLAVPAMANNYQDTNFAFSFNNKMQYTAPRLKQDTSKLYMKCDKISVKGATYTAHAIGTNKTSEIGSDCSRGNAYVFKQGTKTYLTSWVHENGYKYARIGASPNYAYKFTASGVWSPDNYNKY